jgi:bifunctional UDP-N-acetylglucosamine pyrophosphorylase/glucosamine-1-phosphate N-acetyltransferase
MPSLHAIILAAGAGTRMKSRLPKVLHPLAGRPMIHWVLEAARKAGAASPVVVLGHQAAEVLQALPQGVPTVLQAERLGTGHAVQMARKRLGSLTGDVLVLCGDAPLIRPQTLRRLVQQHRRTRAAATVLTAQVPQPFGYGRVVRSAGGRRVEKIVEERDASETERRITEINSGAYCFSLAWLWKSLAKVGRNNRKGEYYLTDVVGLLNAGGQTVGAFCAGEAEEVLGVNCRAELAQAAGIVQRRVQQALLDQGVTIVDPARTWVEPGVRVGADTVIWPETYLLGATAVGPRCVLGPGAFLDSARVGAECRIRYSMLEHCRVGARVKIGPYSHVRRGSAIGTGVHIGNFAEINRSRLSPNVKMGHVSYLGDARVGRSVNIGAGTITANYDGAKKHATRIGEKAFIGSGTVIVAPSTVGAGALTGAGAVLKRNTRIPANMVAVGVPARVIKKRQPVK